MTAVKKKPQGLDRPSTVKIIRLMSRANTWVYAKTGGRLGGQWRVGSALRRPVPICLLTTTGRTSGRPRTVPLCYLQDGERVLLVASQGGLPSDPQWYRNILAEPNVDVQVKQSTRTMRARAASAAEHEELWPRMVDLYSDFESYQSWTDRKIPIVICEPA